MANIAKFTRGAVNGLSLHDTRAKKPNGEYYKHKNQEIDTSKSHLNYNLAPHSLNPREFINQRLQEVHCLKRADVKVMATCIVTKPIGVKAEEQELFFKETYKFLEKDFGKENVAGAWVHLDETTPHLHFSFVPVTFDKKKEKLKVSAKEVLNRSYFEKYHTRLEKHLEKVFGREVGILNEATKEGNKAIDELKRGTAIELKKNLESDLYFLEKDKENAISEIQKFRKEIDKYLKNSDTNILDKFILKTVNYSLPILKKKDKEIDVHVAEKEALKTEINDLKIEIKSKDRRKESLSEKKDLELKDLSKEIEKLNQEKLKLKERVDVLNNHKIQAFQGKGVPLTNAMYHDLAKEIKARIKKAVPEIDEKVLDNALRDSNPVFKESVKAPKQPTQKLGMEI